MNRIEKGDDGLCFFGLQAVAVVFKLMIANNIVDGCANLVKLFELHGNHRVQELEVSAFGGVAKVADARDVGADGLEILHGDGEVLLREDWIALLEV